ncbi:MAG TPA: hypothetical protein VE089_05050 [Nitrososphaeraceae archaeon]|jgi:hypothetical protein|nr:hypothetical protein [Nitrososphaeraceae archaeon]
MNQRLVLVIVTGLVMMFGATTMTILNTPTVDARQTHQYCYSYGSGSTICSSSQDCRQLQRDDSAATSKCYKNF